MRFAASRRHTSAARATTAAIAVALALFALGAGVASAATFYKWTDRDGTVHYGDAPPKGFTGTVTRVEVNPEAHTAVPPAPPKAVQPAPGPAASEAAPEKPDLLTERRATRARLEADLEKARERVDLARKALAESGAPQDDEWQVIAQRPQGPGAQVPRSNCHKGADGKLVCPGRVPNEAYYSRMQQLEEDVKRAEQELEEAERAYRRGVD